LSNKESIQPIQGIVLLYFSTSSRYLSFPTEALLVGVDATIPAADCPGLYALTFPTLIFCSRSKRDSRLLNGGGDRGGELEIQNTKNCFKLAYTGLNKFQDRERLFAVKIGKLLCLCNIRLFVLDVLDFCK
jgi:hypothetical protein